MADHTESLLKNLETFVAFARKRLGDPHLAEDVVQDSLLKALRASRQPSREEDIVAWFYRILRRSIIDLYRRRGARDRALEIFKAELPDQPDASTTRAICQCFKRVLPRIPEQYSSLLREIDLEGNSLANTAVKLRVSANSLTVRLHRARKRLRDELETTCRICSTHGCLDCTCEDAPASKS